MLLKSCCAVPALFVVAALLVLAPSARAAPVATPGSNRAEAPLTLVDRNAARSVIVLAENADPTDRAVAEELQGYLRKISGAAVQIVARGTAPLPAGLVPILIGEAARTPQLDAAIRTRGTDPASFALRADADAVRVVGLSPEGTRNGVYELLEQLGVRWFMPGELGTVIPALATVRLPRQETVQVPSFSGRWQMGAKALPEWARHVRLGGPYFPGSHGIRGIKAADFKVHPEYFALVKGKRSLSQLDISNPDVLHLAIEATKQFFRANPDAPWMGLGPNDGGGFCECEKCRALDGDDWDPFANEPAMTDRYIWFMNQVLDGIKDEFPNKKLAFYSYHTYMRVPVKTVPNPRIVPAFAPIGLCRVHGIDNPVCPERSYYKKLMESWGKLVPEIYERGYVFNLADPGFPFSEVHKLRTEIPAAYKLGIKGWRSETINHWGSETPTLYLDAKLMWNQGADVDALLADFYQKFFGPAERPMADYFTMMDAALRDGDYHTGSAFDTPLFYPRALRDKARKALRHAAAKAGTGVYARRVAIFQGTFNYLESFCDMQENLARTDFPGARRSLDRLDAEQKVLIGSNPPLVNAVAAPAYMKRFFRQPVEQGFARYTVCGGLIAPLRDEWQFQVDPNKVGEDIGLWRPEAIGSNWTALKTTSRSWSDQGLRYYKGEAWYRQEVVIPPAFAGKRVFLWFGGVDEKAKVWVNGSPIGVSHGAAFLPFEFDATAAVKPGARNVVAVRLANYDVDELGTGGITAPAMFYVPAPGATPDNRRQAAPTFP